MTNLNKGGDPYLELGECDSTVGGETVGDANPKALSD
jgi:hypothetical protein